MRSTYRKDDVILLLKDITGQIDFQSTLEREQLIQKGRHYCEMLPIEYEPSETYMEAYREALKYYAEPTAKAICKLGDKIMEQKGNAVVLISLARAGIPVGILLRRYMKWKYDVDVFHYAISIIRGRGIDHNAMKYILERHDKKDLLFVDGWTGKGAILKELKKEIEHYGEVSSELAVVADPANITKLCGTHEDLLIPSSCLNSIVSGLISRTVLRGDLIGEKDFHGAVYYEDMVESDLSYAFIDAIASYFSKTYEDDEIPRVGQGIEEVEALAKEYGIGNINFIKPGIGETTRVLLRRVPWKVLVSSKYKEDEAVAHILKLADEKAVPVEFRPLVHYKTCGIIKSLADD